ncbi:hypothetical protein HMPREF9374_1178 [Desmospora sp. 8437]|nr:hypothetical protein HMPREF9374_1178 [Desmospora sp. 8437]
MHFQTGSGRGRFHLFIKRSHLRQNEDTRLKHDESVTGSGRRGAE